MAGSYHELCKEPNNATMFETVLKFCQKQLDSSEKKAFGVLDPKQIKFSPIGGSGQKKSKLRKILLVAYFVIGLLLAFVRGQKSMLVTWPKMLLGH